MRLGRWSVAVIVLFCGSFVSLTARAQLAPPPSPDIVGVNDLLCIGVWDNRPTGGETLKTVRVDPQGNVTLYYIGQVKLAGLNFEQAEAAINTAYRNNGVLQNPAASLNRLENGNNPSIQSGQIGPNDRIAIHMLDLVPDVDQSRLLTVSAGGKVGLPLLGQFQVAGMTEAAAEQAISRALSDRFGMQNVAISVLRLAPKHNDEPSVQLPSAHPSQEGVRTKR